MANQKLTDKTALEEQAGSGDLLMVVDVSDTTGSAAGTSKKIDFKYVTQTDVLSYTSAQVNALNTTPQTLVAAPGAGYIIQPITATCICTFVSTASTLTGYLYIGYGVATGTNYWVSQRDFNKNEAASRTFIFGGSTTAPADGTFAGTIENGSLNMNASADFATGDWTMKVAITYQIVKIS
jgi:hypothetical protein